MSDEGFHEIQLNGKQLVFLFMAATVVSVVIFLCGVMVGRGVRAERGEANADTELTAVEEAAAAEPSTAATPPPASGEPSAPPPETPAEPPDFEERLTAERPVRETLRSEPERTAERRPAAGREARPEPKTKPEPKPAPEAESRNAAASGGFAVQLAALRDRSEADAIVKRLAAKGYPAYVQNPLPGRPAVYRVQVGRYKTRDEAEAVAARLKREEQFSPWIIR